MQSEKISDNTTANIDDLDTLLASKVKDIIERQWGKSLTDIKHLSVEQFYERRIVGGQVSYKPINRFVIYAQFHTAKDPRRLTFSVSAYSLVA
ncbi:MAG TPA: hypothetical protein VL485_15720 [Ktedonobacteraceae bacterium]|nr:hypothetical protein [Ktedonobacteraceae bacterium]